MTLTIKGIAPVMGMAALLATKGYAATAIRKYSMVSAVATGLAAIPLHMKKLAAIVVVKRLCTSVLNAAEHNDF